MENYKSTNLKSNKPLLTTIELFSGLGAQKRGIDLTGLFNCKVIATSDIEKDVMVSYAAIHDGLTNEYIESYDEYPSEEDMRKELIEKNIGFNFKKNSNPILKAKGYKLKKYWLAMRLSNNLGDISRIKELPLSDIWTYSFPCQDISVAGRQAGIIKGETRSGLLYEVERLLSKAKDQETLPKYLMLENVKNLVSKKFIGQFNDWISRLDELGFNTYWEVVNAKNCGIPQNRERVFAISIRKDIDTKQFKFMKPFDVGLRLCDFLEKEVDKKYYLSEEIQKRFKITDISFKKNITGTTIGEECTRLGTRDFVYNKNGIIGCLSTTDYKQPKQILEYFRCVQAGSLSGGKWDKMHESIRRYYSPKGIAPTICGHSGGHTEPKILQIGIDKSINNTKLIDNANCITAREDRGASNKQAEGTAVLEVVKIPQATKQGYIECEVGGVVDLSYPNSKTRRGRVQDRGNICPTITSEQSGICRIEPKERFFKQALATFENNECEYGDTIDAFNEKVNKSGCCPTLTTRPEGFKTAILPVTKELRIRKLTPKECWRLMGFSDSDYEKATELGLSDSAGYKQAGNSIVTNCIMLIMEHLYKAQYDNDYICTDEEILENLQKPQAK